MRVYCLVCLSVGVLVECKSVCCLVSMVVEYVYIFSMVVYVLFGMSGVMFGFGCGWHYINVLSHDSHASTGGNYR